MNTTPALTITALHVAPPFERKQQPSPKKSPNTRNFESYTGDGVGDAVFGDGVGDAVFGDVVGDAVFGDGVGDVDFRDGDGVIVCVTLEQTVRAQSRRRARTFICRRIAFFKSMGHTLRADDEGGGPSMREKLETRKRKNTFVSNFFSSLLVPSFTRQVT